MNSSTLLLLSEHGAQPLSSANHRAALAYILAQHLKSSETPKRHRRIVRRSHVEFNSSKFPPEDYETIFHFQKHHCRALVDLLKLPDPCVISGYLHVLALEALSIFLRRLTSPCRLKDLVPMFGQEYSFISAIFQLSPEPHLHVFSPRWQPLLMDARLMALSMTVSDMLCSLKCCKN
jgi:hypothetical protein